MLGLLCLSWLMKFLQPNEMTRCEWSMHKHPANPARFRSTQKKVDRKGIPRQATVDGMVLGYSIRLRKLQNLGGCYEK